MSKTAAERQRDKRERDKDVTENVTGVTVEPERDMTAREICSRRAGHDDIRATLEHYHVNPSMYVARREPDKLNWGPWMNSTELEQAGLKANRVAIPGDWDYDSDVDEMITTALAPSDEYQEVAT